MLVLVAALERQPDTGQDAFPAAPQLPLVSSTTAPRFVSAVTQLYVTCTCSLVRATNHLLCSVYVVDDHG